VTLKIVSDESGKHTISRAAFQKGGAPLKMYLRDKVLNMVHDLDHGNYEFYLPANTNTLARFEILFEYDALNNNSGGSKEGVTSIDEVTNHFSLVSIENGIILSSTEGLQGEIKVYDVSGRVIHSENIVSSITQKTIYLTNSTGLYIVTITDIKGVIRTERTFIN